MSNFGGLSRSEWKPCPTIISIYIVDEGSTQIEEVKKELKGLKAVIGMGPGYTFEVSRVLDELGIEVVWALAVYYA